MKKFVILLITVLASAFVLGCGGEPSAPEITEEPVQTQITEEPTQSMFDLAETLRAAHKGKTELSYASSSDDDPESELAYVCDIDYGKVKDFLMLYAADGNKSADEIVVIVLKDQADVKTAVDMLRTHVEKRKALYDAYEPALAKALNKAEVFSEGRYAVLIVSENAYDVRNAFMESIG